jgi:hypothetical protein
MDSLAAEEGMSFTGRRVDVRECSGRAWASGFVVLVGFMASASGCDTRRARRELRLSAAHEIVGAFTTSDAGMRIAAHYRATTYILEEDVPAASQDSVLAGLESIAGTEDDPRVADVIDVLLLASRTWKDEEAVARLQRIYEATDFAAMKSMTVRRAVETGDTAAAVRFLGVVAQRGYEGGAVLVPALAVEILATQAGPSGRAHLSQILASTRLMNPYAQQAAHGFVRNGVVK